MAKKATIACDTFKTWLSVACGLRYFFQQALSLQSTHTRCVNAYLVYVEREDAAHGNELRTGGASDCKEEHDKQCRGATLTEQRRCSSGCR